MIEQVIQELRKANPWAVPQSANCQGVARASKNLKIELRRTFPGVKFSVTSEKFAGGDSISVSYVDGPSWHEVERIVGKYERGSFNAMEDLYEYDRSEMAQARSVIFGSTKYTHVSRKYSAEVLDTVAGWVEAKFGISVKVKDAGWGASLIWPENGLNCQSEMNSMSKLISNTAF